MQLRNQFIQVVLNNPYIHLRNLQGFRIADLQTFARGCKLGSRIVILPGLSYTFGVQLYRTGGGHGL